MKIRLIFFIISTTIFILSLIAICCAPIINRVSNTDFENWKSNNCQYFSDMESLDEIELKTIDRLTILKNLCNRQKAMYNLEYASLIIGTALSFVCFYLSFLLILKVGTSFKNKIGIIGVIAGIICFILTFVYVCYSGYIFNNDPAYGAIDFNYNSLNYAVNKLFSNGATYKWLDNKYITAYEDDTGYYSMYIKYKDLGDKQYNYDKDIWEKYQKNRLTDTCYQGYNNKNTQVSSCDYLFPVPTQEVKNKYLYDRWLTTLVLSCFIFIFNLCLSFFGFLLYKEQPDNSDLDNSSPNILQINTKNNNNNEVIINNENNPN